jgi:nesprin-2
LLVFQEALKILNTNSLVKYVKAVEELKHSEPEDVRLALEEESRGACAKWEVRASLCLQEP